MRYICYWLMVVLPIWQDSPLSGPLGSYGYSIIPLISLIAGSPFLVWHARKRVLAKGTFTDTWAKLCVWLVVVNIIVDFGWILSGNPFVLRGEDIVSKSLKGLVTAISICSYLMITSCLARSLDEEEATRPFFHTFLILTVVAVLEYAQLPNALPWAHYSGVFPYNRPRFLTTEASWTTPLIIVYGGVALHYCFKVSKKRVAGYLCIASIAFMFATTVAKSFMVIVIIGIVVGLAFLIKKDARWCLLIAPLVLVVLFSPGVFDRVTTLFQSDIDQYTSTATRSLTNIVAFLYSLIYPFGTGNAIYLQLFPDMLQRFMNMFNDMGISLNMSEVLSYIYSNNDFGMSAKSGLLQYGMYCGIFGTAITIRSFWLEGRFCREDPRCSRTLRVAYILAVVSVALFATFDSQYEFFSLMALLDFYVVTAEHDRSKVSVRDSGRLQVHMPYTAE